MQARNSDTSSRKAKGTGLSLEHGTQARHPVYPLYSLNIELTATVSLSVAPKIPGTSLFHGVLFQVPWLPYKTVTQTVGVCVGQVRIYQSRHTCLDMHVEASSQC